MQLDEELCLCFHVTKRKVINFLRVEQPKRASQLSECFGAGTGCGWCIPYLVRLHRQIVADEVVEGDDISPEEYEKLRLDYLTEVGDGDRERNRPE